MDNTTKTKTNSFNDHDSEAFLLMEATGDSDEVLDPNMNNDNYHDNDDDAESCSFDASVSSSSSCLLQDLVGEGNDNEVEVKNEDNVVDHVGGTWSGSGRDVVDKFMNLDGNSSYTQASNANNCCSKLKSKALRIHHN